MWLSLGENDKKLKDCCTEVYKGFRSFGLKWYKFSQFKEMNGLVDSRLDSTKDDTNADEDDFDEQDEDLVEEEGDLDGEDELGQEDEDGEDEIDEEGDN